MESTIKVICFETEAFHKLIDEIFDRLNTKSCNSEEEWIDTKQAMALLKISAKSTLQKLRDTGEIRFSQPMKRHILYSRPSLLAYLDRYVHETF